MSDKINIVLDEIKSDIIRMDRNVDILVLAQKLLILNGEPKISFTEWKLLCKNLSDIDIIMN